MAQLCLQKSISIISMNDKQTHNMAAEQPQNNDDIRDNIRESAFLFGSDNDDLLLDESETDRDLDSSRNSSTGSAEGRSEKSDGMLEAAEKGDKIISASRCIFFGVLCVSAAVCASVAFWLYRNEETTTFNKAVRCD